MQYFFIRICIAFLNIEVDFPRFWGRNIKTINFDHSWAKHKRVHFDTDSPTYGGKDTYKICTLEYQSGFRQFVGET